MQLLVVDHDLQFSVDAASWLTERGHSVEHADNAVSGLHLAAARRFDLVVLNAEIQGLDCHQVIQALRIRSDIPVLLVSACGALESKVDGLEAGGDDYLVKPVAMPELMARIQAATRRHRLSSAWWNHPVLHIGDLTVDLRRRRATRSGKDLKLTAMEFGLLTLFACRQGRLLSRTTLAEEVWDTNFDSASTTIEVAIRRLRRKLDDPFSSRLLHTVRGMGYVLEQRTGPESDAAGFTGR